MQLKADAGVCGTFPSRISGLWGLEFDVPGLGCWFSGLWCSGFRVGVEGQGLRAQW